ncbi:MAG: MlaD family protein [Flavobacteriales bacterium]
MKNFCYLLCLLLFSCADNSYTLYVKYNGPAGLVIGSRVTEHGNQIGEVVETNLLDTFLICKIKFNDDRKIPVDSRFRVYAADVLGTKEISIDLGKDKKMYSHGDTILASKAKTLSQSVDDYMKGLKKDTSLSRLGKEIMDVIIVLDRMSKSKQKDTFQIEKSKAYREAVKKGYIKK